MWVIGHANYFSVYCCQNVFSLTLQAKYSSKILNFKQAPLLWLSTPLSFAPGNRLEKTS